MTQEDDRKKWEDVLKAERDEIKSGRDAIKEVNSSNISGGASENNSNDFVGLAFSGGGIRSATFNLGILQALAELRLLRKIDYLSTVSGGGYIGSWLSSWMASHDQTSPKISQNTLPTWLPAWGAASLERLGNLLHIRQIWSSIDKKDGAGMSIIDIENALAPDKNSRPVLAVGKDEPHALRHLRSYTDYLKPHGGLFRLDAMTAFTTWLRNSLLNQLILFAVFAALLLLPLALGSFLKTIIYEIPSPGADLQLKETGWLLFIASFFLAVAIGFINVNIWYKPAINDPKLPWYSSQAKVKLLIVLPLVLCSLSLAVMLPSFHQMIANECGYVHFIKSLLEFSLWTVTSSALFLFTLIVSSPLRLIFFKNTNRRESSFLLYLICFAVAAILGMYLLAVLAEFLASRMPTEYSGAVISNIVTLGPPLILLTFALAVFIYVGLLGREFDEHQREWWSRLVAMVVFASIGWLVLCGISVWGPLAVDYLKIGATSVITWLITSGLGAALGKNESVSTVHESKGSAKWLAMAAQIAPPVFIVGLCLLVAYLLNMFVMNIPGELDISQMEFSEDENKLRVIYFFRLYQLDTIFSIPAGKLLLVAFVLFFIGAVFSWRVDINAFSFHSFYRNRLTRAYLAAGIAHQERDNAKLPLTGMNDRDSPRLDRLPSRPYHIVNTALNITSGNHLSWQERKAASFLFSKRYCGYFLQGGKKENNYCETREFLEQNGWISLSLPMTISGAAASPNGGYHTSPALAFLMTVFNVRLGWWMQNTGEEKYWKSKGPKFSLRYLLKELTADADENSPFVYLSDGGHFENLGIYELVRRECRLIVACDAGADPDYEFEDLGNAIRKCYIDLGVRIDINTSEIKPLSKGINKGRSPQQSAVGLIHYPNGTTGVLLYIKASMGFKEAADIEQYKSAHPDFPHDPTANQFFTESQFESYRKLGYRLCSRIFSDIDEEAAKAEKDEALKVIAQCLGKSYKAKEHPVTDLTGAV